MAVVPRLRRVLVSRSAMSGPGDLAGHVVHGREDLVPDLRPRAVARVVEKAWFHPAGLVVLPVPFLPRQAIRPDGVVDEAFVQVNYLPLLQPPAGGDCHPGRTDTATLEHAHRNVSREDVRIPVRHVGAQVQDVLDLAVDGLPCGTDRLVKLLAQAVLPGVLQPPRQRRDRRRARGETSHALPSCLPALLSLSLPLLLLGLGPVERGPLGQLPAAHLGEEPFGRLAEVAGEPEDEGSPSASPKFAAISSVFSSPIPDSRAATVKIRSIGAPLFSPRAVTSASENIRSPSSVTTQRATIFARMLTRLRPGGRPPARPRCTCTAPADSSASDTSN